MLLNQDPCNSPKLDLYPLAKYTSFSRYTPSSILSKMNDRKINASGCQGKIEKFCRSVIKFDGKDANKAQIFGDMDHLDVTNVGNVEVYYDQKPQNANGENETSLKCEQEVNNDSLEASHKVLNSEESHFP